MKSVIDKLKIDYFHSKGLKEIYKPPHLLMRLLITAKSNNIPIDLNNDYLVFTNQIVGFHGKKENLSVILNRFKKNKTHLIYITGYSGYFLINKSTMLYLTDIENIPFPENEEELELNEIEKILTEDVFNYQLEYRRQKTFTKIEKNATIPEIQKFSEVYCKIINTIYKTLHFVDIIKTENYYCCFYSFGKTPTFKIPKENELEIELNKLLIKHNFSGNIRYLKIMRIYEGNTIIIIKPKQLRFWLRSIAIIDADETVVELHNQGY